MRQAAPPLYVFEQARKQLRQLTPPQVLLSSYVLLALAGTLLLKLPAATTQPISWLQAMFTAVSASTITGLVVVDTGTHFTLFGQLILLLLIQAGALGLVTFGIFVFYLSRGDVSFGHRTVVGEALNQSGQGDIMRLLRWMVSFTFAMELIGTLLLALYWVPELGWSRGLYYSFFHAVSAFNNAGFALASDSFSAYVSSPLINLVISALFIAGSIGFFVVADIVSRRRVREYSLHTKLMLVGTVVINLVSMMVLLVLEHGNPATLGALPDWGSKLWAAWFQGVVPRSSGFNTVDIGSLHSASAFYLMGMMFIGGGSGSTGGGIKLTTFIVLLLATRTFLWQQERPVVFGRSISSQVVLKALAITVIALFFAMTGTFLLTLTESAPFLDIAFEAVSASATVGLSRGLTAELSAAGQIIVMVLMLIGRVGPLALAFMLSNRRGNRIRYPEGQVNVG